jgi:CRISPR-associated protein Cmr2
MTDWKRKLAAFLHDPPHKPFRIAGHEDARKSFWLEAGLDEEEFKALFERQSDHWAAAADRMIFPDPVKSGVRTDWKADADCAFHHPLCGEKLTPETIQRCAAVAERQLHAAQQNVGIKDDDSWEVRWWKTWRVWPESAARKHPLLAYLAADTRIPHHTLWHHNGLVSALSTCETGCSFLLFQIGPVQDFIKQARSTRDLWAGSYLLSYLIAKAMFAVARSVGPESIVYPQLRGVPLVDWFGFGKDAQFWNDEKRASFKKYGVREELLTPNLPNRFLALVPKDWKNTDGKSIATVAEEAVRNAWQEIAGSVHAAIQVSAGSDFAGWDDFWNAQAARFPMVDYMIHDWQDTKTVLEQAEKETPPLHDGWKNHPLKQAIRWANEKIAPEHKDSRCYPLNPGFIWALHYAAVEWKFAAVKNARSFSAWGAQECVEKDHLDGRNEVLGGEQHEAFWDAMRGVKWAENAPERLFKGRQEYGALTTVKRLFPFVWMQNVLDSQVPRFESVQDIAEAIESEQERDDLPKYYAILAMDGDDMGKWVSGTKTPPWKDVLSGTESDPKTPLGYFKQQWGNGWEDVSVPLTPSFHAALSESLGNFSLYCARQIVEEFGGQLIYAGGDDVLAMLPATEAIDCAIALQLVFRGMDPAANSAPQSVQAKIASLFDFPAPGFIRCKEGAGKGEHTRPNWPLMVMGPKSTASVGIAIGHVRSPMQDVVQAARDAEHTAKKVKNKAALALRILKRSGEAVEFATRFDSGALGVWADLAYHDNQLSGRFIYRFLQKLTPVLSTVLEGRATWEPTWERDGINLISIAEAELEHSLDQQSGLSKDRAAHWISALKDLNPENFLHFWMARAFINRLDRAGKETNP